MLLEIPVVIWEALFFCIKCSVLIDQLFWRKGIIFLLAGLLHHLQQTPVSFIPVLAFTQLKSVYWASGLYYFMHVGE